MLRRCVLAFCAALALLLVGCAAREDCWRALSLSGGANLCIEYGEPSDSQPCTVTSFALANVGSGSVDLTGWKLFDYNLPDRLLEPGQRIHVQPGTGVSNNATIYSGRDNSVWPIAGIYVTDPQGNSTNLGLDSCSFY